MNANLTTAREYASRPADQRFPSLGALIADAKHERELSKEVAYNLKDLRAASTWVEGANAATLQLESPKGRARFSHWSFGQLCRMLGAPASYLRELPPTIAADCLNHGLTAAENGTSANLLVRAANGTPEPVIRACTSKTYGRVWDHELYSAVDDLIARHSGWTVESVTRGDRDSVLTISNKRATLQDPSVQRIVNDPQADVGGIMYRSLTIGNSEVGGGSVWYEGGIFRARCKNLMLWSAVVESRYRRRHVGSHVLRDVVRNLSHFAFRYLEQSSERDEAIIRQLIDREIASTREGVIDELRAMGATQEQAQQAYATCEMYEAASPRSFWGVVQGMTRASQQTEYSSDRLELDRLAAQILQRGARQLVAA